jgi:hypothetical protein
MLIFFKKNLDGDVYIGINYGIGLWLRKFGQSDKSPGVSALY